MSARRWRSANAMPIPSISITVPAPGGRTRVLRHLPLDDIRAATVPFIASLDERPFDNAEAEARRLFLLRQTRAIVSRIDIVRGARPSFAEEARTLFGLGQDGWTGSAAHAREAGWMQVYAELERLLPGAGDLSARYAAFDGRFLIPPDRLAAVLVARD